MSITLHIDRQPEQNLNYSNRNAAIVLGLLGIDTEAGYGQIALSQIPAKRRAIIAVLNTSKPLPTVAQQAQFVTSVTDEDGLPTIRRTLRHLDSGLDEAGIQRRLLEVAELLATASELESDVSWY